MNNRIPVTRDMAAQIQSAKEASRLAPNVRKQIQMETLASQRVAANKLYYSRVRFEFVMREIEGSPAICLDPGKRYAFGYQLQQEVDGHTGHRATYADTNLLEARSTNKGETVRVLGIGIRHTPFTDAYLAAAMDMFVATTLRIDNDNLLHMGNPSDVPGSSQQTEGTTWVLPPNALETDGRRWHPTRKGDAFQENMLVLAEPIIWTPEGVDSKLDVMFDFYTGFCHNLPQERTAKDAICCDGPFAPIPEGPELPEVEVREPPVIEPIPTFAPTFQSGWKHPADKSEPGMWVDYFVKLYCHVGSNRSKNE